MSTSPLDAWANSAGIIPRLELTREIINEAWSKPRLKHQMQVNLLCILCGTRFQFYYKGTLLPTWCPNKHHEQVCGQTGTFEHMLQCYNQRQHVRTGPAAIDVLVLMAKRTLPKGKNVSRPRHKHKISRKAMGYNVDPAVR